MSRVKDLFLEGIRHRIKEHDNKEAEKVGTLRGGNSGCITADNKLLGQCGRIAYLRAKGINPNPIEEERELMFAAGRSNEDTWLDALKRTWTGPILCEEDIPTSWKTQIGMAVTGRPDIVLCEGENKPVLGIELKLVSSLWTARDILINDVPKMNHLVQAAHYSWQLEVPFELWYTSRADYHIGSGWERRVFKKGLGLPMMETNDDGHPKKLTPFVAGFTMHWDGDRLVYTSVQTGRSVQTLITQTGINKYYNQVADMDVTDKLPPRPEGVKGDGSKSYSACDYCALNSVCDKVTGTTDFYNAAKQVVREQEDTHE